MLGGYKGYAYIYTVLPCYYTVLPDFVIVNIA